MIAKDRHPTCPVGEKHCEYLDEIASLRKQVRELSKLVHKDSLTGMFNFRFLIQSLELEMERTRRCDVPTVLILADLDHFKQVNDTWGHKTGNDALVQIANSIRGVVRKLDIPCRFGGEEFAIILPSTELLVGIQVAERIRNTIQQTPLLTNDGEINLTASFGVDVYVATQNETPELFLKRTDHYLYQAKTDGRNCVAHATSERIKAESNITAGERNALFNLFRPDKKR